MDLRTAIVQASSLEDLLPLVREAKEDVTFFGHCYTYIEGYDGTLPIDALALRIISLVWKNIDFQQHPEERDALEEMIPLITKIYTQNDARLLNPVKSFLVYIRKGWVYLKYNRDYEYSPRKYWHKEFSKKGYNYEEKYPHRMFFRALHTHELAQTALKDAASFADMLPLVKGAKADISFFGCRFVTIENYDETLPINALAQRVMEIANNTLDFSQDKSYQEIAPLIDTLYQNSDEIKNEKNLFTRILCSIRDIWNSMWKQRSEWEQNHRAKEMPQDDVLQDI